MLEIEEELFLGFAARMMSLIKEGSQLEAAICLALWVATVELEKEGIEDCTSDYLFGILDKYGVKYDRMQVYETIKSFGIDSTILPSGSERIH